jgi:hypothetical protein
MGEAPAGKKEASVPRELAVLLQHIFEQAFLLRLYLELVNDPGSPVLYTFKAGVVIPAPLRRGSDSGSEKNDDIPYPDADKGKGASAMFSVFPSISSTGDNQGTVEVVKARLVPSG